MRKKFFSVLSYSPLRNIYKQHCNAEINKVLFWSVNIVNNNRGEQVSEFEPHKFHMRNYPVLQLNIQALGILKDSNNTNTT